WRCTFSWCNGAWPRCDGPGQSIVPTLRAKTRAKDGAPDGMLELLRLVGPSGLFPRHFAVAALDLFRRDVLDMGANPPLIPQRILDAAGAVAVGLARGLVNRLCPGFHRALVNRVHVFDVQIEHGRFGRPLVAGLSDHQHGVANAHLGMGDFAYVVVVTVSF